MKFRPCIDLHDGQVKQIVGGSLNDSGQNPATNFVSSKPSSWYANLYREDNLSGGHVIKLGANNDQPAKEALAAWPGGLQIGGGITAENASYWMEAGAAKVIVTSFVFSGGRVDLSRLEKLVAEVGKENLVLDLSCRQKDGEYFVVTDRWQTFTDTAVNAESLTHLSEYCSEFLVHGVDVEGLQQGMDEALIGLLAANVSIPCVYAGGVRSFDDLQKLKTAGNGKIDVTVGSALDLFGGQLPYRRVVDFCTA